MYDVTTVAIRICYI